MTSKFHPGVHKFAVFVFCWTILLLVAGALGILLIIEAIVIWRYEERRWLRWFAVAAVGGVIAQAILGGQVVIQLLHYWLPVLHACFAQIMFGAILCLAVFTSKWWTDAHEMLQD